MVPPHRPARALRRRPTAAPPRETRPVIFTPPPICFYTFTSENWYDSLRLCDPRHRILPRHRRRIPLLPPADQRNRRAGKKRSRTLEARMHKRDPEGFRQPLPLHAEGQDLRADGPAPAGIPFLPCRCPVHWQPDRLRGL